MSKFSKNSDIAKSNLEAIMHSPTYQIAHEDQQLLNSDEMRGVRTVSYTHLTLPTNREV